jgi:acyl carrier protein
MTADRPNGVDHDAVRSALLHALASKLSAHSRGPANIDEKAQLVELGLVDSADLVEIILEVEQQSGCEFDPQQISLETGLTIASLSAAFLARGAVS